MKVSEILGSISRLAWVISGGILLVLIGLADFVTGEEISFSIFYLLPVMLVTWYVSRRAGLAFAIFSAIAWLLADLWTGHRYSHPAIPYWNMIVRFLFFLIVLFVLSRLQSALEQEKALSRTDSLTGTATARTFQELARVEIQRGTRYGRPFTVAYIDLDNFKEVNDRFGHSVGNELLCTVAATIRRNLRATDTVARLGGDEFAILLPETEEEPAHAVLGKLRGLVSGSMQANDWPVTLSIGAFTFLHPRDSVDQMIRLADEAMYSAKRGGKNRIRHEVHGG